MNKITFSYRGRDSQGAPASGTVEAADKDDALRKLRLLEVQGLRDLSIEGVQQLNGSPPPASTETGRRFCGSCGKENPAEHRFCAGCGKPLGEVVQDRSAGQPVAAVKQGHRNLTMKRVVFLVCLSVILVGATVPVAFIWSLVTPPLPPKSTSRPSSSPSASAAAQAANANYSLEYKLAVVDSVGYVSEDHITVARFRSLLDQLSSKYVENKQEIADMTVTARQLLRDDGIEESLLNMMEGMNQVFIRKIENQQYAEYITVYVTLRRKGQSHVDAISGLQGILRAVGAR